MLSVLFNIEAMGLYDRIMMEDGEGNWTNILGVLRFKSIKYETVKTIIIERLKNVDRCRSKMIKIFGSWYFKRMDDAEFETKKDFIV